MAITLEQAKVLRHGDVLHENGTKNADGTCRRWRVNGQVKTWKRNLAKVRVPLKHGMWAYDYLDESDLNDLHLESECPHQK